MRIFLTGATGYIGSAVLEAVCAPGTSDRARSRSRKGGACLVARWRLRSSASCRGRRRTRRRRSSAMCSFTPRSNRRSVGQSVDRQAIDTLMAAAARRADAGLPACVVYTSGIWVLGVTRRARRRKMRRSIRTPHVSWRPEHEALVLEGSRERSGSHRGHPAGHRLRRRPRHHRRPAEGRENGLLRVVGDGRNHWPCIYDRDLADLYVRVAATPDASGDLPRQRRSRRTRGRHRRGDLTARADPHRHPARADRGSADEDGHVRRRAGARSDRQKPARPRAGLVADAALGGRQRGRVCSKNSARPAKRPPKNCVVHPVQVLAARFVFMFQVRARCACAEQ